jgi:hypothetical protein
MLKNAYHKITKMKINTCNLTLKNVILVYLRDHDILQSSSFKEVTSSHDQG